MLTSKTIELDKKEFGFYEVTLKVFCTFNENALKKVFLFDCVEYVSSVENKCYNYYFFLNKSSVKNFLNTFGSVKRFLNKYVFI